MFLAMEFLEGESLAHRLAAGAVAVSEAVGIALGLLAALGALHERDLVHRDVKPANLFLTPHGLKLLDFGLATRTLGALVETGFTGEPLTLPGTLVGTPCYMAPEQVRCEPSTPSTDLFAVGAILFEMLTGRQAFGGASLVEVLRAVEVTNPPALTGSPALVAVDQVLHVALAKNPANRYRSAAEMAGALRAALRLESGSDAAAGVREIRRLIVLPFRPLRKDPESDFLAMSLPDAITHSLAGLGSLVVRSSLVGARYDGTPDIHRLAIEADVDLVLAGTLLRSGDRLQVNAQLFETPSGTLLKSHIAQVAWGDIFDLQSTLVDQVVGALGLELTPSERHSLERDVPTSPEAYQIYLRANEAASQPERIPEAMALYEQCLERDPHFAPAMARLGRCYRYQGKYDEGGDASLARAESMLLRALGINSDLALAHSMLAQLEADRGRAREAMTRLLNRLRHAPNSPDLYTGLVYACRFCGLLEASLAAHRQAQRLDSRTQTSVTQTYFALGDYQRCLETEHGDFGYVGTLALFMIGRETEAARLIAGREPRRQMSASQMFLDALRALVEGRRDDCVRLTDAMLERFRLRGEELFYAARHYAWAREVDKAATALEQVVETGYFSSATLSRDPWLIGLRGNASFEEVLRRAGQRHELARQEFAGAGGSLYLS
jgi:non-specific serine/threonine protein kinase